MIQPAWDRRIERAEELANTYAASAEMLRFYSQIGRFQKIIYENLTCTRDRRQDTAVLLPHFPGLLSVVTRSGTAPLVHLADGLAQDPARWQAVLEGSAAGGPEEFFARALLQPYFEYQAGQADIAPAEVRSTCPFCGGRPQVAVLRGEGDGGKRSLICSLCATEWAFRRLLCPSCAEENERQLPAYTPEEFSHVRIEACDTCHVYVKSVDLTRYGLAVPVVDELATVWLDVWAEENGYAKLQVNLLGV
jgi:FdhE protein